MNKVTIHRLATGVPGLDELLGGGIPEFSFNLVAGTPGSGKTTLAHQIMFSLATPERKALSALPGWAIWWAMAPTLATWYGRPWRWWQPATA